MTRVVFRWQAAALRAVGLFLVLSLAACDSSGPSADPRREDPEQQVAAISGTDVAVLPDQTLTFTYPSKWKVTPAYTKASEEYTMEELQDMAPFQAWSRERRSDGWPAAGVLVAKRTTVTSSEWADQEAANLASSDYSVGPIESGQQNGLSYFYVQGVKDFESGGSETSGDFFVTTSKGATYLVGVWCPTEGFETEGCRALLDSIKPG